MNVEITLVLIILGLPVFFFITERIKMEVIALLIMTAVLLPVLLEWLPISIAGMMGATLMLLFGCLTMEEAYRYIELKAIFLIAGMLPLGVAMEQTGAAAFLAEGVIGATDSLGPRAVIWVCRSARGRVGIVLATICG